MAKTDTRMMTAIKHYVATSEENKRFSTSMMAAGYGEYYASQRGNTIFQTDKIQYLIKKEQERIREIISWTAEDSAKALTQLVKECETAKDRANKISAIKELNRVHGLYKDDGDDLSINQNVITEKERKLHLQKELKLLEKIEGSPYCIAE